MKVCFSDWESLIDLNESVAPFERLRKVLHRGEDFEVILNVWGPGHTSALHGHGGSDCTFKVLAGEIIEKRFFPYSEKLIEESLLSRSDVSNVKDTDAFHSIHAVSLAISLHIYRRPLTSIQVLSISNSWEQIALS